MLRSRRVGDKVGPGAVRGVAPDVMEVEPVTHLMNGGARQIERRNCTTMLAEGLVQDDDAIRFSGAGAETARSPVSRRRASKPTDSGNGQTANHLRLPSRTISRYRRRKSSLW